MRMLKYIALGLLLALGCARADAQQSVPISSGVVVASTAHGNNSFKVLLNQNVTNFSFSGVPQFAMLASVIFQQNATGGFTVSGFASNITSTCTVSATANATTVCLYQYDTSSNSWTSAGGGNGSGTPGGSAGQIQWNNSGAFAGMSGWSSNGSGTNLTGGSGAGLNMAAASFLTVPNIAGASLTTNGQIAYDTTLKNYHLSANGADNIAAIFLASLSITNNDCVKWSVSAGAISLADAGAACGSGGSSAWSSITGSSTNTNTGFVLAPSSTSSVPWTINCPSGITVDCFDIELNSSKVWWIDSSGNMNFAGTNLNVGSGTSSTAAIVAAHGGNTAALPGCFEAFNNADAVLGTFCGNATQGRLSMNSTVSTIDIVQNYILKAPAINAQTGTTYTVANGASGDFGKFITRTNASAMTDTIPQAGAGSSAATEAGFGAGWFTTICVLSSSTGSDTLTPTTSTINGSATLVLSPGQCAEVHSNGTNYIAQVTNPTGGSSGLSGMTASQVPIAATVNTITSSVPVVGTDAGLASAGTLGTVVGKPVVTDGNGGVTTVGGPPDLTAANSVWYPFGIWAPQASATASTMSISAVEDVEFYLVYLPVPAKITTLSYGIAVGAASSTGDVGIYSVSGTTLTLVAHTGGKSTASTGALVTTTLGTPVTLSPGPYYIATCNNNITVTVTGAITASTAGGLVIGSSAPANTWGQDSNAADQCTAGVLQSTATLTNISNSGNTALAGVLLKINN